VGCAVPSSLSVAQAAQTQIQALTEQLQLMAMEREQLKGQAAHGRLMVEAAEHSFRGNLAHDVQFHAR